MQMSLYHSMFMKMLTPLEGMLNSNHYLRCQIESGNVFGIVADNAFEANGDKTESGLKRQEKYRPLDGANSITIAPFRSITDLFGKTFNRSYSTNTMFLYNNFNTSAKFSFQSLKFPLLFITTIYLEDSIRVDDSFLYMQLSESISSDSFDQKSFWIYKTLGSAEYVVIYNSDTFSDAEKIIFNIYKTIKASICTTNVISVKKHSKAWDELLKNCNLLISSSSLDYTNEFYQECMTIGGRLAMVAGCFDCIISFNEISSQDFLKLFTSFDRTAAAIQTLFSWPNVSPFELALKSSKNYRNENLCQKLEIKCRALSDTWMNYDRYIASDISKLIYLLHLIAHVSIASCLIDVTLLCIEGFLEIFCIATKHYELNKSNPESNASLSIEISNDISQSLSSFLRELHWVLKNTIVDISSTSQLINSDDYIRSVPEQLIASYTAYSYLVSQALTFINDDDSDEIRYFYLLAPDACDRLRTHPLFKKFPNQNRVLIMGFPGDLIINPSVFIPALVHEIAHYSGDTLRFREIRKSAVINATANWMYSGLLLPQYNEVRLLIITRLNNLVDQYFRNDETADTMSALYLDPLSDALLYAIRHFSDEDDDIIIRISEVYKQSGLFFAQGADSIEEHIFIKLHTNISSQAIAYIAEVRDCVSEAYSDIVAIKMLDLSMQEYLDVLLANDVCEITSELYYKRLQFVFFAMDKRDRWNLSDTMKTSQKYTLLLQSYKDWDRENSKSTIPNKIFKPLFEYFSKITCELDECANRSNKFSECKLEYRKLLRR